MEDETLLHVEITGHPYPAEMLCCAFVPAGVLVSDEMAVGMKLNYSRPSEC